MADGEGIDSVDLKLERCRRSPHQSARAAVADRQTFVRIAGGFCEDDGGGICRHGDAISLQVADGTGGLGKDLAVSPTSFHLRRGGLERHLD